MAEWLILHTLSVAALAALAFALGRFLRPGPAVRHALWLLVLVKLLTPPFFHWPWTLPVSGELWHAETETLVPMPLPSDDAVPMALDAEHSIVVDVPAEAFEFAGADDPRPVPVTHWSRAFAALWAAGGLVTATVHGVRVWRLQRQSGGNSPPPACLSEAVGELAATLRIRPPRVNVLEGITSPMVWGFGPARLLWPARLEERLSADGVRTVLSHELAHLRRLDHRVA